MLKTRAIRTENEDAGGGCDEKLWGLSCAALADCWVAGAHDSQAAVPRAGLGRSISPGALRQP